jgi:hypothetical protein
VLARERLRVVERAREHVDMLRPPTLPSTTAALRFVAGSFARCIGEPLNAARTVRRVGT